MTIQFNLSQMLTFKYGAVAEAVEILIEQLSRTLSCDFWGGEWVGVELENGGFYAIPAIDVRFVCACTNNHFKNYLSDKVKNFRGVLSANAFGLMISRIAMDVTATRTESAQFREYCHQLDRAIEQHPEAGIIQQAL